LKITSAECFVVEIPFSFAGSGLGIMPLAFRSLEFALIRLEDENEHVGWGEGFGYFTVDATKAITDRLILPRLVDAEVEDIREWHERTQLDLHLFGRYGVTMFALSGVDIALWDLAAKRAGRPLYSFLGTAAPRPLSSYASLLRYGDADLATAACREALAAGYRIIKLHETDLEVIAACRDEVGPDIALSVDVNCQWGAEFVRANRFRLIDLGIAWLEEPLFPPEDFAGLRELRSPRLPLAAGENWCTATQFAAAAESVDIWQPSVTKVGGITEYLKILQLAAFRSVPVVPHCPYFGPGFYATLHLATAHTQMDRIEILWVDPDAWLSDASLFRDGPSIQAPTDPGLGFAPDPDVLARYRRA
jgi:L-alanine-DL-glutamate epimerase-like enolase superfamily enzyme